MKHGLLSQDILLPGEDEEAFEELSKRLRDELQPVGELESLFVDRIIATRWGLRRLGRVEAGIFAWERYGISAEWCYGVARSYERSIPEDAWEERLKRPIIMDEQKYKEALSQAEEMEVKQLEEPALLSRTFIRDADKANTFSKLSRYEMTIERSLYRALHELQRLQAARRAEGSIPPPATLDVDISGILGDGP
jgi:hypothetical protein